MSEATFTPFWGQGKGITWAADIAPEQFAPTMEAIGDADGLAAVKIGFELGLGLSLAEATRIVHANSNARVQYDHQKAGNDIPETSMNFARAMVAGGVDSAILFPFTGPETQIAWTRALRSEGITVFIGAEMTHKKFKKSEGGSIPVTSLSRIIDLALDQGVDHFIVPGNKEDSVRKWRGKIERARGIGNFALGAPGFVNQGGHITEAGKAAGKYWTPIIGRGIHANDKLAPRQAVEFYASQLRGSHEEAA